MRKAIITIIGLAMLSAAAYFAVKLLNPSPLAAIEKAYEITIPADTKIIESTGSNGDVSAAKLRLTDDGSASLIAGLSGHYGIAEEIAGNYLEVAESYKSAIVWWDIDKDLITGAYTKKWTGKTVMFTVANGDLWVYITREPDGSRYAYLLRYY